MKNVRIIIRSDIIILYLTPPHYDNEWQGLYNKPTTGREIGGTYGGIVGESNIIMGAVVP